jgi:hypothetical protein
MKDETQDTGAANLLCLVRAPRIRTEAPLTIPDGQSWAGVFVTGPFVGEGLLSLAPTVAHFSRQQRRS